MCSKSHLKYRIGEWFFAIRNVVLVILYTKWIQMDTIERNTGRI